MQEIDNSGRLEVEAGEFMGHSPLGSTFDLVLRVSDSSADLGAISNGELRYAFQRFSMWISSKIREDKLSIENVVRYVSAGLDFLTAWRKKESESGDAARIMFDSERRTGFQDFGEAISCLVTSLEGRKISQSGEARVLIERWYEFSEQSPLEVSAVEPVFPTQNPDLAQINVSLDRE